jgi:hypothetical protein
MTDALYVLGTVLFFGLMIKYASWCDALGKRTVQVDEETKP